MISHFSKDEKDKCCTKIYLNFKKQTIGLEKPLKRSADACEITF